MFSLTGLKSGAAAGVDATKKEDFLSTAEFEAVWQPAARELVASADRAAKERMALEDHSIKHADGSGPQSTDPAGL